MEALETAGLSTGFIIIVGILYRVLKKSDFSFNSSCKRHIVETAKVEVNEYIKEAIHREMKSMSPSYGSAKAPELPDTPPAL